MKARRQGGAVAVVYVLMVSIFLAVCGVVLELVLAFQRQGQLQQIADMVALAAAQQLNGTGSGVLQGKTRAMDVYYAYSRRGVETVVFDNAMLQFSSSPSSGWVDYAAALAAPAGLRYVRSDTAALDPALGTIAALWRDVTSAPRGDTVLRAQATAGPRGLRVLPLAICALSSTASAVRANGGGQNELVEYGFRYGVTYNLLALNPASGAASGEYFLVDPLTPPTMPAQSGGADDARVAPYLCSGQLAYPSLGGGPLHLRRPASFSLWQQLNSRFGSYGGNLACDPYAAPPDSNVRSYVGTQASWMNSNPPQASAASTTPAAGLPLTTIADRAPPLAADLPARYGTLWAFGPAKRSTGASFAVSNWSVLYPAAPNVGGAGWQAGAPPYHNPLTSTAPAQFSRSARRLLHVPLLACPVPAGAQTDATVLAIGRFLLTSTASAAEVPAEFAGVVGEQTLSADVELLQ